MWLNAYGESKHHVFFGISRMLIQKATLNSQGLYNGVVKDAGNVFHLTAPLKPGTSCYWRVDAEVSQEEVYRGDVWLFTTKKG